MHRSSIIVILCVIEVLQCPNTCIITTECFTHFKSKTKKNQKKLSSNTPYLRSQYIILAIVINIFPKTGSERKDDLTQGEEDKAKDLYKEVIE